MLFPVSVYHLTQQQVEFIVLRAFYRFSCHYLLINLAIWNPRGGAWVHVHHCGSLEIVVELSLLLSSRCKSQSRVGWKGQCAQANPERDPPDGDPSYVRAAVRTKQQLQRQQDLPRRKAGEVLVCTESLLMKTWHQHSLRIKHTSNKNDCLTNQQYYMFVCSYVILCFLLLGWAMYKQAEDDEAGWCSERPGWTIS